MNNNELLIDARFLDGLITVSRNIHVTMSEDALLRLFADVFEDLLKDSLICIRLVKDSSGLNLVYANGRLLPRIRDIFQITQDSMEGLKLTDAEEAVIFAHGNVRRTENYRPIFENGHFGFTLLLCDRTQLYGAINVEYPVARDQFSTEADRQLVLPFVHHLVAALRNTRLMTETLRLKEHWAMLVDNANAPVVVVDREGRITLVNKTFEAMVGLDRTAYIGEEFLSLIPTDNRARLLPFVINAIRGEPSTNIEMRFPIHGSEDIAHIAFNAAPLHDSEGAVDGVIFVGQDLTMIRELQRQIIHTEKLATLGQVAAGVAHELNNPLTSISVYANYLLKKLDGVIDESDYTKLERILNGANRIQAFTRDLVTYARPSSDEPEMLDIGRLIEHAVSFCEHTIHAARAEMTIDIAGVLSSVYGIRGQLEQVFVNLITNACHALPDTGGAIRITAGMQDRGFMVIRIADSGGGISENHLKRIFEPFFTTKDVGKGTGLGLSIVRNILKNHDATISVTSELGKGTEFVITMRTT